jgi:hypothetical protein
VRFLDGRLSTSPLFLVTLLKACNKVDNQLPIRSLIVTNLQDDHFITRTWGQQSNEISQIQESLDNLSSQMSEEVDRLEIIGKDFAELKQGQIVTVYLFVIAFLMGLAFIIFGLYIGQEQSLFTDSI